MRLVLMLLAGVLACVGSGCGGSDAASGETNTVAAGTARTGASSDFGSEDDCLALTYASEELELSFAAAAAFAPQEDFGPAEDVQAVMDRAPAELRPDLDILADAYAAYGAVLRDADSAGDPPDPDQLLEQGKAAVDQEELAGALERLGAWAAENCQSS